jgi:hypothetical protein
MRWFRGGQKWRTGCEGRISVVKRRMGRRDAALAGSDQSHATYRGVGAQDLIEREWEQKTQLRIS